MEAKRRRLRALERVHKRWIDKEIREVHTKWQFGECSDEYFTRRESDLKNQHAEYVSEVMDEWDRYPRWWAYSITAMALSAFWAAVAWLFSD